MGVFLDRLCDAFVGDGFIEAPTLPEHYSLDALHPDLRQWIEVPERWHPLVKHPVLVADWIGNEDAERLNRAYLGKAAKAEEFYEKQWWADLLWLIEKPYRGWALHVLDSELSDEDWSLHVSHWYQNVENIGQDLDLWCDLLTRRHGVPPMMDEDELAVLASLPETVTVYRGYATGGHRRGLAWTLDEEVAQWFARRAACVGGVAMVVRATVRREDVIAYFAGRHESEVVALPRAVYGVQTIPFTGGQIRPGKRQAAAVA